MSQPQKLLIANFNPVFQMARPTEFRQLLGAIAQRLEVEPDQTFVIGLTDDQHHQLNSTVSDFNTSNIKIERANDRTDYPLTSASRLPPTPLASLNARTTPKKMVEGVGAGGVPSFLCSAITLSNIDKLGFSPVIDLSSSTTNTNHPNSCPDNNQRTQGWLRAVGLVPPHLDIYYDFEGEEKKEVEKEANTATTGIGVGDGFILDHPGIALAPTAPKMQAWQDSGPVVIIPPPDPVLALFLGHAITHYLAFDVYEPLYIVTTVQPLTLTEWD